MRLIFLFLAGMLTLAGSLRAQEVNEFWRKTRDRLAHEPMEARVEPVSEAVPYKKVQGHTQESRRGAFSLVAGTADSRGSASQTMAGHCDGAGLWRNTAKRNALRMSAGLRHPPGISARSG